MRELLILAIHLLVSFAKLPMTLAQTAAMERARTARGRHSQGKEPSRTARRLWALARAAPNGCGASAHNVR